MRGFMSFKPLTKFGQVSEGDKIIIVDAAGKVTRGTARVVLNPGAETEEVIYNVSRNYYFIVHMFLAGESWAKSVLFKTVAPAQKETPCQSCNALDWSTNPEL